MKHIPQLDGLRAIAVMMVLCTHFWTYPIGLDVVNRLFAAGWIGVDLFFVLSGFLITTILQTSRTDPHYFRNFYARRSLRIFPAYYLLLALVLVALPLVRELPQALQDDEWMYWLYLGNFALATGWQLFLLDITWSLSLEEQFYWVWPVLNKFADDEGVLTVATMILGASVIVRGTIWDVSDWMWLHMFRLDGFAVGAIIAVLPRDKIPAGKIFAVCFPLLAWLIVSGNFERDSAVVGIAGYTLTTITCGSAMVLAMRGSAMAWSPLRYVGKVSYGVYLFHPLCLLAASAVLPDIEGAAGGMLRIIAVSALTIVVATLSFRFYEMPFLRLKDRFAGARQEAPRATVLGTR